MTNAVFYLLDSSSEQQRLKLTCRLLEKAYHQGRRLYVNCETEQEMNVIDELLWTGTDTSFIPHNLASETLTPPPPIQIGFGHTPKAYNDILVNYTKTLPDYITQFKRVIEVIPQTDAWRAIARDHYKEYRASGCELTHHKLSVASK